MMSTSVLMSAFLLAGWAQPDALVAAQHLAKPVGDALVWTTRLAASDATARDVVLGPAQDMVATTPEVTVAQMEDGCYLVGVPQHAWVAGAHGYTVELQSTQPQATVAALGLRPPWVLGLPTLVQVVSLRGGQQVFQPSPDAGLEHHGWLWAQQGVNTVERMRADHALGQGHTHPTDAPMYVTGERVGGIAGRLESMAVRRHRGAVGAAALGAVALLCMWVAWRAFSRRVKVEEAENILAQPWD